MAKAPTGRGVYWVPAQLEIVADSAEDAYARVFAAEAARSKARPDASIKIRLGPRERTEWYKKEPQDGADPGEQAAGLHSDQAPTVRNAGGEASDHAADAQGAGGQAAPRRAPKAVAK